MANRKQKIAAYLFAKEANRIRQARNVLWNLLQGYDADGNQLNIPLSQLRTMVQNHIDAVKTRYIKVRDFINNYPNFWATIQTLIGIDVNTVITKIQAIRDIYLAVEATLQTATGLADFTQYLPQLETSVPAVAEISVRDSQTLNPNIVNDLFDAISYSCRGINPDDGSVLGMAFQELKDKIQRYFDTMAKFAVDDSEGFITHRTWVGQQLATATDLSNLISIADYIDANIGKLPLVRRTWAYG